MNLQRQALAAEAAIIKFIDQVKPGERKKKRQYLMATSMNKDLANTCDKDDYPNHRRRVENGYV